MQHLLKRISSFILILFFVSSVQAQENVILPFLGWNIDPAAVGRQFLIHYLLPHLYMMQVGYLTNELDFQKTIILLDLETLDRAIYS